MPLIDSRGRVFGVANLIDALVVLVLVGVVPLVYGAFVLFRIPAPTVAGVEPARIDENRAAIVRIAGANLRPWLTAHIGTTRASAFLTQGPTSGEIHVPALPAGTYDVVLSEEGQEIVRAPGALTVAPAPRAAATVRVEFIGTAEAIAQLSPGDADIPMAAVGGTPPPAQTAVLTAIGADRRAVDAQVEYWLYTKNGSGAVDRSFHVPERLVAFVGTLAVPVIASQTGWTYKDLPIKVGARFPFETRTGMIVGSILSVDATSPSSPR